MSRDADSAGLPWAGRHFDSNEYSTDDGTADPALRSALEVFGSGAGSVVDVVDAVRSARLLIPLLARMGEAGELDGRVIDKTQELSIVTVEAPDGRSVLPAFSSVDAMRRWDPKARPVPSEGRRVALAAAGENTDLVVLDAGSPTEFAIRRPAVWAIARGEEWVPSYADPAVAEAFAASIGRELAVHAVELAPGDPGARLSGPELIVRLAVTVGLTREELDIVLGRLATRWAADDVIATRVDSLRVELVPAA